MRLHICWGTGGNDCHKAHQARRRRPRPRDRQGPRTRAPAKVAAAQGSSWVHALTGSYFVPVLVLDDGTAINVPDEIVAWAKAHPARH